jgi:hypothetical protein
MIYQSISVALCHLQVGACALCKWKGVSKVLGKLVFGQPHDAANRRLAAFSLIRAIS